MLTSLECDTHDMCKVCKSYADKIESLQERPLDKHICIRQTPSEIGPAFEGTITGMSYHSKNELKCINSFKIGANPGKYGEAKRDFDLFMYFDNLGRGKHLQVSVKELMVYPTSYGTSPWPRVQSRKQQQHYVFARQRRVPGPTELEKWATAQMQSHASNGGDVELSTKLDLFIHALCESREYKQDQVRQNTARFKTPNNSCPGRAPFESA